MAGINGVLGRSGGTVTTAAPAASAPGASANAGAYGTFTSGLGDVTRGRVSLLMLDSLILLMVLFYLWTHRAQGGG